MATRRHGLPYIWVTHLAHMLGGRQCLFSLWFKSRYRYDKFEEQALDLVEWNRQHNALMAARRRELEREGFTVTTEDQNAFKLQGKHAVVAGKPDIVATKPGHVLVVDGKTGRQRESDIHQVLFYLYALPKARPDLQGELEGEVQYAKGDERITLTPDAVTPEWMESVVSLIKLTDSPTAPRKVPSRDECQKCNIGPKDCPQRVMADREAAMVGDF